MTVQGKESINNTVLDGSLVLLQDVLKRIKKTNRLCTGPLVYLLHDWAGTLDELPLGEAVSGAELQSSSFLDQVDAAVSQFLNPRLYLVTNLKVQAGDH